MDIKIKDLVEYLLKQDQEAIVILDHDGWDIQESHKTPQDVIKNRGLFIPWKHDGKNYLIIQN
jgi:hypothetical protein